MSGYKSKRDVTSLDGVIFDGHRNNRPVTIPADIVTGGGGGGGSPNVYQQLTIVQTAGDVLDPGAYAGFYVFEELNLKTITMLADVVGGATVDVWVAPYASSPPDSGDSITGGNPLVMSGTVRFIDSTLSGWNETIPAGSWVFFVLQLVSAITRLSIGIHLERP